MESAERESLGDVSLEQDGAVPEGLVAEVEVVPDASVRRLARPKDVGKRAAGEASVFPRHCVNKVDQGLVTSHGFLLLATRDRKGFLLVDRFPDFSDELCPAPERLFHLGHCHFLLLLPRQEEIKG